MKMEGTAAQAEARPLRPLESTQPGRATTQVLRSVVLQP